jgi:hypothetical protein
VSATVYLEGGGNSKALRSSCRAGFRRLLESADFKGRLPKLVACGSRGSVYDDFKTAHADGEASYVAMLIDSEEPVTDLEETWDHLGRCDGWEQPDGADNAQVLFMTTCMELGLLPTAKPSRNTTAANSRNLVCLRWLTWSNATVATSSANWNMQHAIARTPTKRASDPSMSCANSPPQHWRSTSRLSDG